MLGRDNADDDDREPGRRGRGKKGKTSASGELRRRFESSRHASEFPDHRSVAFHQMQELVLDSADGVLTSALKSADSPPVQSRLLKLGLSLTKGYADLVAADDRHRKALRERDFGRSAGHREGAVRSNRNSSPIDAAVA